MNTLPATLPSNVRRQLPPVVGVTLAVVGPPLYSFVVAPGALKPLVDPVFYGLLGPLFNWILIAGLVGITTRWYGNPSHRSACVRSHGAGRYSQAGLGWCSASLFPC